MAYVLLMLAMLVCLCLACIAGMSFVLSEGEPLWGVITLIAVAGLVWAWHQGYSRATRPPPVIEEEVDGQTSDRGSVLSAL